MDEKIEVFGSPVLESTEKPPPHNPLRRPAISYKKPIWCLTLYTVGMGALSLLPAEWLGKKWIWLVGFTLLYGILIAKRAVIWLVHLYQNKASDKTRLRCVFEPSCSEYMLLAVDKYGVLVGVCKGVFRLLRCHPPNGGVDYP